MDIILNTDLKHILQNLNLEQKGLLLDKLLNQDDTINDDMVKSFYTYIQTLQDQKSKLKEKMKKLSILGHQKRWNQTLESPQNAELLPPPCRSHAIRKEPKEDINNNLNINIKNNNLENEKVKSRKYHVPCVDEVKEYVAKHNFLVDATEFVDFYESRGWCVGNSEIKNWQATVRMWNRRAVEKNNKIVNINYEDVCEDEHYWHELKEKFWNDDKDNKDSDKELYPGN